MPPAWLKARVSDQVLPRARSRVSQEPGVVLLHLRFSYWNDDML